MAGSKISRSPTRWSYEKEVGDLYCTVNIGASGAVSSVTGAAGILSVAKEATAGQYTITLAAGYQRLLHVNARVVAASASSVANVQVLETPSTLQDDFKSANAITIQCLDFAGAAVNPASGAALMLNLVVRFNPSSVFDGTI